MSIQSFRPRRKLFNLDFRSDPTEAELITNPMVVNVIASTSNTTITLNITDDGTSNGEPLFDDLDKCYIDITTQRVTTSNNEAPWAYVHSINSSTNELTLVIKRSNTGGILLGGTYQGNQDNNNEVTLRVLIEGRANDE